MAGGHCSLQGQTSISCQLVVSHLVNGEDAPCIAFGLPLGFREDQAPNEFGNESMGVLRAALIRINGVSPVI
jgi:hypothetical protein